MNEKFFVNDHWYKTPCVTDFEPSETEETTDPEVGKFVYDVRIHNAYGWDTYTVAGDDVESAVYKALKRVEYECGKEERSSIDLIRIYMEDKNDLLKEIITKQYDCENIMQVALEVAEMTNTYLDYQTWDKYCKEVKKDGTTSFDYTAFDCKGNKCDVSILLGYVQQSGHYFVFVDYKNRLVSDFSSYECERLIEPEDTHIADIKKFKEKADLNSSYGDATEPLTAYQFERLTRTLYKSLFKAIGLEETKKIPFIISNNMVFFNYNGVQYKYYPSQCKIFKKCGKRYQRINWKDFADDNSLNDQKQAMGRSPPLLLI